MKETNTNIQEHIPQVTGFCYHTKMEPLSLQHNSFTQTNTLQIKISYHIQAAVSFLI